MYFLTHEGENVGTCELERGDPSAYSVSGVFNNLGGAKALAAWIKSVGGQEDDGVVFLSLSKDFTLFNPESVTIEFQEGNLIVVPEEDEAYLDITGISEKDYRNYFAGHISAMES